MRRRREKQLAAKRGRREKTVKKKKQKPVVEGQETAREKEAPEILQKLFQDPEVWSYLSLPNVDQRLVNQLKFLKASPAKGGPGMGKARQRLLKVLRARLAMFEAQEAKMKHAKRIKRKRAHEMRHERAGFGKTKEQKEERWKKTAFLGEDLEKHLIMGMKIGAFRIFYYVAGGVPWNSLAVQRLLEEFEVKRETLWGVRNASKLFKIAPQTRRYGRNGQNARKK